MGTFLGYNCMHYTPPNPGHVVVVGGGDDDDDDDGDDDDVDTLLQSPILSKKLSGQKWCNNGGSLVKTLLFMITSVII